MFDATFPKIGRFIAAAGMAVIMIFLTTTISYAVPSMGRQTGMQCASCHTVFPELTPFGRQFKLRGFSMGGIQPDDKSMFGTVPVSFLLQVSRTSTQNIGTPGATPDDFPRDRQTIVQAAGLYYGGKITDKSGALIQYFYNGIERKWGMEMFDVRYADSTTFGNNKDLIYGVTLNNSPTLSDIYNSTPVWNFPHADNAGLKPAASAMIDMMLGSQVGGVGAYTLWNNLVYAEVAAYRTTNSGVFRPLGAGVVTENVVKNNAAPYWRLALQHEWGSNMFSVGTYGMVADIYPDRTDLTTPTNRFKDIAFDAQYQYLGGDHVFSAHGTRIRESQDWTANFASGMSTNPTNTLTTVRLDAHYYYQRRYGGGVQYFSTSGSADPLRYSTGNPVTGSATGSPDTRGWIAELNYLPIQNVKLALRYTAYNKFNGDSTNYDGFGRNASANNNIFLLGWLLF